MGGAAASAALNAIIIAQDQSVILPGWMLIFLSMISIALVGTLIWLFWDLWKTRRRS
jgi:hypothetical protein